MNGAYVEAAAASIIKDIGWQAWRQAPISNGSNLEPSKIRLTPRRIASLLSISSGSVFIVLVVTASRDSWQLHEQEVMCMICMHHLIVDLG